MMDSSKFSPLFFYFSSPVMVLSALKAALANSAQHRERMVFPVWRSLHSFNLMLPKEDRHALLLRLYNDSTPLVNTTQKRESLLAKSIPETSVNDTRELDETDALEGQSPPVTTMEDNLTKQENLAPGQEVQDMISSRETHQIAEDEDDLIE